MYAVGIFVVVPRLAGAIMVLEESYGFFCKTDY